MGSMMIQAKQQRRFRTRAKIFGTAERPRLSVHISNRHITAQLIDDTAGQTLLQLNTATAKDQRGTLTDKAKWVGEHIAELAAKKSIKRVVFDRGTRIYHGRLHALAEAARAKGLEF